MFLGSPMSHTNVLRRQRPSMSAALSPAGPAPTMTQSYVSRGESVLISP